MNFLRPSRSMLHRVGALAPLFASAACGGLWLGSAHAQTPDVHHAQSIAVEPGRSIEPEPRKSPQPAVMPPAPMPGPVQPRNTRMESVRRRVEEGRRLSAAKQYEQAVAAYSAALEIEPDHAAALNGRGIAYRHLRRLDDAIRDYERILQREPRDKTALYNRGLALRDKGDLTGFARDVRAAAALGSEAASKLLPKLPPETAAPSPESAKNGGASQVPPASPRLPSPTPPPLPAPLPPAPISADAWVGTWSVSNDWGSFLLTQNGASVSGEMSGGWAEGKLRGNVSGTTFDGVFQRSSSSHIDGQLRLTLAADGRSFSGQWKWNESGVWAGSTFTGARSSASAKAKPADVTSYIGTWHGVGFTVGTIEIKADGTYVFNGKPGGTYAFTPPNRIQFFGSLKAWDNGRAVFQRGNLEFEWQNSDGSINAFNFSKGR